MLCRICEERPESMTEVMCGRAASGVCTRCGAGVCLRHGRRAGSDARILCPRCPDILETPAHGAHDAYESRARR